ncbi:histidine phosphatase family protein [Clostridium sp. AL.422]|uniref:histidine phosphatase family protein n=1 Tax=Clostridium TaxID=1485 RepID=UPI00293DB3A8|nr:MULTISPECIES: histidine phosphatase family protein [unclassified Clostridium]MDV4151931.1 histidine phosphatase family protein [Clostridium sp. AL.422]
MLRHLSEEGINDSNKVTEFLKDKNITKIYSSPYKRSIDTINDFASSVNMDISLIEYFRERKISNEWIEDFNGFAKMQWNDFNYRLKDGENLKAVQKSK